MRASITASVSPCAKEEMPQQQVREVVLSEIALGGSRSEASLACSGLGLCLAGVGYDLADLAVDKVKAKSARQSAHGATNKKSRQAVFLSEAGGAVDSEEVPDSGDGKA